MKTTFYKTAGLLTLFCLAALQSATAGMSEVNEEEGEGIALSELLGQAPSGGPTLLPISLPFFNRTAATPAAALKEAYEARLAGHDKTALKQFTRLIRRWPESPQAAAAQRAAADLYLQRDQTRKAFEAYVKLLEDYPIHTDNNEAIDRLFEVAEREGVRRRLRWMFGGFTAPERAIEVYEKILEFGPQHARVAEAQFKIAVARENSGQLEEAVAAYTLIPFRYPKSPLAEQGAFKRAQLLHTLSLRYPRSESLREDAWTAALFFLERYPQSEQTTEIQGLRDQLHHTRAHALYEKAVFYETLANRPASAVIYYEKLLEEFPQSEWTETAKTRLTALKNGNPE